MGLIARMRAQPRRLRHVWGWRLRYWWLDTASGQKTRLLLFALCSLGATVLLLWLSAAATAAMFGASIGSSTP